MPFIYAYLFGSSLFFIYWVFLFVKFKSQRKVMLGFSLLFGVIGFFSSYFWFTVDWWAPETVFGGHVGIEDFILGFTNGGIASVGYLLFFKENVYLTVTHPAHSGTPLKRGIVKLIVPLLITPIVTFALMWLNVSSFYANCLGIIAAIIYILTKRKDLIKVSLVSGLMLLALSLPIYFLLILISPGWVESTWMIDKLSGIMLLGIPIEDYIWYFLSGAIIGILYPYANNHRQQKNNL